MDCGLPGSSVHEISQARVMEWAAISFSRGSSQLRDQIHVSCIGRQILYHWATCEAHVCVYTRVCMYICTHTHTQIYFFLFQILFHYRLSASLSTWHSACPQLALDTGGLGGSPTWCGSGRRKRPPLPASSRSSYCPGAGKIACSVKDGAPPGGWEGKERRIPVWMENSVGSPWLRGALI